MGGDHQGSGLRLVNSDLHTCTSAEVHEVHLHPHSISRWLGALSSLTCRREDRNSKLSICSADYAEQIVGLEDGMVKSSEDACDVYQIIKGAITDEIEKELDASVTAVTECSGKCRTGRHEFQIRLKDGSYTGRWGLFSLVMRIKG